jgi:nucleoside-diphosphate-sugar epimerase
MSSRNVPLRTALLITGGSGFIGQALIRELLCPEPVIDASEIRIFDLHEPAGITDDPRIRFIQGDIRNPEALNAAAGGVDAVIHLAAMVDWGTHPPSTVYHINTEGTKNALDAARLGGARAFVHTSSLDAVITGRNLRNVDESLPYPEKHPNAYCGSKAESEKVVARANGEGGMRTVSLRPSGVWGEGDPYHISALIRQAAGGIYGRIGDGSAVQQLVYSRNLANAMLQACRELLFSADEGRKSRCAGKNYFITDSGPENFFRFFDRILEGAGYALRPENLWIPRNLMLAAGTMTEAAAFALRPFFRWNPGLSRFAVNYTCSDFTFTSGAAAGDFGFTVKYPYSEALKSTAAWFRTHGPVDPPVIPEY